ncbi:Protein of unknown function [Nitrosomonas aestuarii]|uniref:DUF1353 domain-containing protein n=1 Tax=Nitrosomonas aestuarii TaxID=52441 RepID=A0A1I4ED03_9PROT|nr:DUF1353 domain-containing protein [Nitrosomonas aestuarii]SFL02860.1 Protein of unknown function [Nitrosomonas aestuarii]
MLTKNKFTRIPAYYMIPDRGGHWISDGYLEFWSDRFGCLISIHPQALNNLASIPSAGRKLINPNGPHRPASALHDALYELLGVTEGRVFTRTECDLLFLDAMLSDKKSYFDALPGYIQLAANKHGLDQFFTTNTQVTKKWMAYTMYAGVHLFGWLWWSRSKRAQASAGTYAASTITA